jgi:hypothetical protein
MSFDLLTGLLLRCLQIRDGSTYQPPAQTRAQLLFSATENLLAIAHLGLVPLGDQTLLLRVNGRLG